MKITYNCINYKGKKNGVFKRELASTEELTFSLRSLVGVSLLLFPFVNIKAEADPLVS